MVADAREEWQDDEINLLDYWRVLTKRRTMVLSLAVLPALLTGIYCYFFATKIYESTGRALERDRPLDSFHRQFVDALDGPRVRILEVGSGPLSPIGTAHPAKRLEIVAPDLLADTYARLLAHLKIEPAIRTVRADAERLTEQFAEGSFDYATANNCIDHCARADRAIEPMLRVARPAGWVSLRHAENEASRTRYFRLHEWNFALERGEPVPVEPAGADTDPGPGRALGRAEGAFRPGSCRVRRAPARGVLTSGNGGAPGEPRPRVRMPGSCNPWTPRESM